MSPTGLLVCELLFKCEFLKHSFYPAFIGQKIRLTSPFVKCFTMELNISVVKNDVGGATTTTTLNLDHMWMSKSTTEERNRQTDKT
jgi:hypothetical protein